MLSAAPGNLGLVSIYFPGNDLRDHWFKVGRTEVGTTLLVVGLVVLSWLVNIAVLGLPGLTYLAPGAVEAGEVWRLVTWPLAGTVNLMAAFNLFFFWMFAGELEQGLGKVRMAQLLGGIAVVQTLVTMALHFAGLTSGLAGISSLQFIVLLLWIAEYPNRPFFFGIPSWVIGAILVVVQALGYMQARDGSGLLAMVLTALLVAMLARRLGLLRDQTWIPVKQGSDPGSRKIRKAQAQARKQAEDRAKDDARLDELLDLISANGIDSLSAAQRRELMKLRSRRG